MTGDTDLAVGEIMLQAGAGCMHLKLVYVDMAGDLIAGILLNQIVYWLTTDEYEASGVRVQEGEHPWDFWVAKNENDWWAEARLSAEQVRQALGVLIERELIVCRDSVISGERKLLIQPNWPVFLETRRNLLAQWGRQLRQMGIVTI